jgi:hypothetical protein
MGILCQVGNTRSDGNVAIIESIVEYGIREMVGDPELVKRAFNQHFKKVLKAQENNDAVLRKAVEDLKNNPPNADVRGEINEGFYTRFEQHSETASTDELRTLFGTILAGEIRKPGTVSAATMHFASMLDPSIAQLIERVLPFVTSHGQAYLECMPTQLSVPEIAHLEMAGFWPPEKVYSINIEESGFVIRRIGEAMGLVIDGPPTHSFTIQIAILSPAGKALSEIIASPFDVRAFTIFAMKKGATGCRIGRFSILEDKWLVTEAKNVMTL